MSTGGAKVDTRGTSRHRHYHSKPVKNLSKVVFVAIQDDYSLQISWSHVYAKMNHKKIQSLTDKEAVETALMIIGQLGK